MALLEYSALPHHTNSVQIGDPDGAGPTLLFTTADLSGFGRDRFHLDLRPVNQERSIAVAIELGATRLSSPTDASWVRMADPEGNRFCLLQSHGDFVEFVRVHGPGSTSI